MFKKLKDKIAEEVKISPQRIQQFTQSVSDKIAQGQGALTGVPNEENHFSLTDEDPEIGGFTDVSLQASTPKARRVSNGSIASDVSFLPRYEASNMFHLQSDVDMSASELEDNVSSVSSQLGHVSKEQVHSAYQRAQKQYHKYRGRYDDLANHYKELERENGKMKAVLVETQDKAIRRVSELREQCSLSQKAKADLEHAMRTEIEEKQIVVNTLKEKIKLLQNDKSNLDEHPSEDLKVQELKANAIIFQTKEAEFKEKISSLESALQLSEEREKTNNLKFAKSKLELHTELQNRELEITNLKSDLEAVKHDLETYEGQTSSGLKSQNLKLIDKCEELSTKCKNFEAEAVKWESSKLEIAELRKEQTRLKEKFDEVIKRNKQLQDETREFENNFKEIQKANNNLLASLSLSEEEINRVRLKMDEMQTELKQVRIDKDEECKRVQNEAKQSLLQLEEKIRVKVQGNFDQKENELKTNFELKLKELETNGEDSKRTQIKLMQAEETIDELKVFLEETREKLNDKVRRYDELENNHLGLIEENNARGVTLGNLQREVTELKKHENELICVESKTRDEFEMLKNQIVEFNDLKAEHIKLTDERKEIEIELKKNSVQINESEAQRKLLNDRYDSLQGDKIQIESELNKQLEIKTVELKEIQSKYEELIETKNNQFVEQEKDGLKKHEEFDKKCEQLSKENDELVKKHEALMHQIAEMSKRNEEMTKQYEEMSKQCEETSKQNEETSKQNEEMSKQNEEMSKQNEGMSKQIVEMSKRNEEMSKRNEEMSKRSEEMSKQIVEMSKRNEEISKLNEQLSKQNEETSKENERLSKQNEEMSKLNEELSNQSEVSSKKHEKSVKTHEKSVKKHEELSKKHEGFMKKHEELLKNHEVLSKKNEDLSKKNEDLSTKNEDLSKKIEDLSKKNEESFNGHEDFMKKHEEVLKENEDLVKKHEEVLKENDDLVKKHEILLNVNEESVKQNEVLRKKHEELTKNHEELNNGHEKLIKKQENLTKKCDELVTVREELTKQVEASKTSQIESSVLLATKDELLSRFKENEEVLILKQEDLIKTNAELTETNVKLKVTVESVESEKLAEIQANRENYEEILKQKQNELEEMKKSVNPDELSELRLNLQSYNESLDKNNNLRRELEEKIAQISLESEEKSGSLRKAQTEVAAYKESVVIYKEENSKLIDQMDEIKSQVGSLMLDKQDLTMKCKNLKTFEEKYIDSIEKRKAAEATFEKCNNEIEELRARNARLSSDYKHLIEENERYLTDLTEFKIKHENLDQLEGLKKSLELELNEVSRTNEILKVELNELKTQNSLLQRENNLLTSRNNEDDVKVVASNEKFTKVFEENACLQAEIKLIRDELAGVLSTRNKLDVQLHEIERHCNELTHEKRLLLDEIDELKIAPLNLNDGEVESLREKVQQYKNIDATNRNSIEFYEGELHKLRNKNEKLNRKLDETLVTLNHCADLSASTEIEYLKNVLYNYMLGKESVVMARVLAAVCKFDQEQTDAVLKHETNKQTLLGQLGFS